MMKQRRKQSDGSDQTPVTKPIPTGKDHLDLKWNKWWIRFWSSLAMVVVLGGILYLGHWALVCTALVLQTMVYREIILLNRRMIKTKVPREAIFYYLTWWWFGTCCFYVYGRLIMNRFPELFNSEHPILSLIAHHHQFVAFGMYIAGFVTFVCTLRAGSYKYQFMQWAYAHIIMFVAVIQTAPMLYQIFEGVIWFLLPAMLIACNDTWAYIWGFFFGKKFIKAPLIALSPNKTWEGFVGAFVSTLVFGFFFSYFLAQFPAMYCPKISVDVYPSQCDIPFAMAPYAYEIPATLRTLFLMFGYTSPTITLLPIQLHSLVLSTFASLVAPFGGFFGSGLKRALKIKDFGDSLPGHGGVTDRLDCQALMAMFAFVYYRSFIKTVPITIAGLMMKIKSMPPTEQKALYNAFQTYIANVSH